MHIILQEDLKMFEMNVPYDKGTMKISLPEKNLTGVLEGKQSEYTTELSEKELVEQSLDNPIGSKSLEELAKGKRILSLSVLTTLVRFLQKLLLLFFYEESVPYLQMPESAFLLQLVFIVQVHMKN